MALTNVSATRLAKVIRRYKPGKDVAHFRNAYAAILSDAVRRGEIDNNLSELLGRFRQFIERLESDPKPDFSSAVTEWLGFYSSGLGEPSDVVKAALSRFPKVSPKFDWSETVIARGDQRLLEILFDHRILKSPDLVAVAKKDPQRFYESAALDLAVSRSVKIPQSVWTFLSTNPERLQRSQRGYDLFVKSFERDSSPAAVRILVKTLGGAAPTRGKILEAITRNQNSSFRLVRQLITASERECSKKKRADLTANEILSDWTRIIGERILNLHDPVAIMTLNTLLVVSSFAPRIFDQSTTMRVAETARQVAVNIVQERLDVAENTDALLKTDSVIACTFGDLFSAIQSYLNNLGNSAGDQSETRGERWIRHSVKREIVEGLVQVLDQNDSPEALNDALVVALFNAGVQHIGVQGEVTQFDFRMHELSEGISDPGNEVMIVRPGRQIVEGSASVIIRRAIVKLRGPST